LLVELGLGVADCILFQRAALGIARIVDQEIDPLFSPLMTLISLPLMPHALEV
jgi:hypothetical protein